MLDHRQSSPVFTTFLNVISAVIGNLVTLAQTLVSQPPVGQQTPRSAGSAWSRSSFLNEMPLVKVNLPTWTPGCDADPAKVACDYPEYTLDKIASKKFADSGSPAFTLVKNFRWTNEDQNTVAKAIAVDKLSTHEAAKKWVEANRTR